MESGLWQDKRYSSCCLMGARAKSQCLRHNLEEINQWPVLDCQHYHDPHEWDPYLVGDTRVYPSHEEAEYTAVIAVSASWWAVRVGRAQLQVPRMPAFFCHGRRDHWLQLDARVFREWAITPLALTLGLTPPDRSEAARVPTRKGVPELFDPSGNSTERRGRGAGLPSSKTRGISLALDLVLQSIAAQMKSTWVNCSANDCCRRGWLRSWDGSSSQSTGRHCHPQNKNALVRGAVGPDIKSAMTGADRDTPEGAAPSPPGPLNPILERSCMWMRRAPTPHTLAPF